MIFIYYYKSIVKELKAPPTVLLPPRCWNDTEDVRTHGTSRTRNIKKYRGGQQGRYTRKEHYDRQITETQATSQAHKK